MKTQQLASLIILGLIFASIISGIIGDYSKGNDETYLIMTSPFMFSIWVPIYLGFIAFGCLQLSELQRIRHQLNILRWWAVIPIMLAGLWISLFPIMPPIIQVTITIATVTTALLAAYHLQPPGDSRSYTWLVSFPINLLAGWITLASAITINGAYGLPGPSQAVATITIIIAGVFAALAVWKLPDPRGYIAAVLWGLYGIIIGNSFAITLANAIILTATFLLIGEFLLVSNRLRIVTRLNQNRR
jgi:hypothetical protein